MLSAKFARARQHRRVPRSWSFSTRAHPRSHPIDFSLQPLDAGVTLVLAVDLIRSIAFVWHSLSPNTLSPTCHPVRCRFPSSTHSAHSELNSHYGPLRNEAASQENHESDSSNSCA